LPYDYTADIDGGKIGCGYSENNLSIFYRPEDLDYWNFNKWKFTFDFTALTSENKHMFYILYMDVRSLNLVRNIANLRGSVQL
jgi:hypothetical protein